MIEPRVYRAAFVPALLAVVLLMFSLESRPRPLPQGLPADVVFAGPSAVTTTGALVTAARDRRAGTVGDRAAAGLVARAFRARGFTTQVDRFQRDGKDLVNVVGRRAGQSRSEVVVVAARDAAGVPDAAGSAADTAALMELARVFQGRPSRKTLVLASVDGSALGEVGTARLVNGLGDPGTVDGVLVVSALGAPTRTAPAIVSWSGDTARAGLGLQRTAAESLREEVGGVAQGASPTGQLTRLAFPLGIGPQGVLLDGGYDAVRIAGGGELPDTGSTSMDRVDPDRIGSLGRATLRTITALDQGPRPERGPRTYVTAVSQVMPGWVFSLLAIALILPALVASIDAFARARRRREPVATWLTWIAAGAAPFVIGLGLAHSLALTGATPDPPDAPVAPALYPLDGAAAVVLGVVAVTVVLLWLALRVLVVRADPALADPSAPGAAVSVALVLSVSALVLWLVNPYTALILAPALHLWILATLVDPGPPPRARAIMIATGLLLPALLVVYQLVTLSIDPVSGAWYLLLLVTGGHVGLLSSLVGCALAAVLGSVIAIARSQPRLPDRPPAAPSVRGPAGYAGPGSLGGTESALGPR